MKQISVRISEQNVKKIREYGKVKSFNYCLNRVVDDFLNKENKLHQQIARLEQEKAEMKNSADAYFKQLYKLKKIYTMLDKLEKELEYLQRFF